MTTVWKDRSFFGVQVRKSFDLPCLRLNSLLGLLVRQYVELGINSLRTSRFLRLLYVAIAGGSVVVTLAACSDVAFKQSTSAKPSAVLGKVKVEMVGYFPDQTISSIAVSKSDRLFVNFESLDITRSASGGELVKGVIRPYPNYAIRSVRDDGENARNIQHRCASQGAISNDQQNRLWVLDCAAFDDGGLLLDTAALTEISLKHNQVIRIIAIEAATEPEKTVNNQGYSEQSTLVFFSGTGSSVTRLSLNLATLKWSYMPSVSALSSNTRCGFGGKGALSNAKDASIAGAIVSKKDATVCSTTSQCENSEVWVDSGGIIYTSTRNGFRRFPSDGLGSQFKLVRQSDQMRMAADIGWGPNHAHYVSAHQICPESAVHGDVSPSAVFKVSQEMLGITARTS